MNFQLSNNNYYWDKFFYKEFCFYNFGDTDSYFTDDFNFVSIGLICFYDFIRENTYEILLWKR